MHLGVKMWKKNSKEIEKKRMKREREEENEESKVTGIKQKTLQ